MIYADGDVYEGDWVDNKSMGEGTLTHLDGGFYLGQWQNNCPHGKGMDK